MNLQTSFCVHDCFSDPDPDPDPHFFGPVDPDPLLIINRFLQRKEENLSTLKHGRMEYNYC